MSFEVICIGFGNSPISFAYGRRILARNQPRTLKAFAPPRRAGAFAVKLLIAFAEPAEQYCLFPCRSLWTFATFAIFSRSPKREASAARLTGSEFRNRASRSKCEIWK